MGKKGLEEGDSKRWCRQVLATNSVRARYLASVVRQKSLDRGGGKDFHVGHDESEVPVGELERGV